ncbi:glycosyl hydrolase family 28-related protein [Wenyingzhuangia sp. 1_MG-2023]|nr:glycosyl hydrolase family 28-related protein [Wenyingzhuangia sp. 1_MG-2023]
MKHTFILFGILSIVLLSCSPKTELWKPTILKKYLKGETAILPNYSYAGYAYGETPIPNKKGTIFNITDFGAIANDGIDDTQAINTTIETAGKQGGGIVYFPKGIFHVNTDTTKTDIVKINYSNIVLRGAGSDENGTIIYSGSSTHQAEDNSPWLSPFVFHSGLNLQDTSGFYDINNLKTTTHITESLAKGSQIIQVASTKGFHPKDIVILTMQNTTVDGNLMNDLMHPLTFEPFQTNYLNAGPLKAKSFQSAIEIDQVIDAKHLLLKQPIRRDISMQYNPSISLFPMLKNIGVEHFKFDSAWSGNYKHHGDREMDYGWGAINLHRVSHGWIRDIHIHNYTQTTHLITSRNITIEDIHITGKAGHYSPKMYHSSDNLVQNIQVDANMTHGPGLEGCSFGNVYRNMTYKYPSTIDLHGMADQGFCPPMYNLFENIQNIEKIAGGGAPQNLPHSGEYNTFWDIEMSGWKDENFQEIFYSWIWRDPIQFKNKLHRDCHKQYLRSNLIGVYSKNIKQPLTIEHSSKDRSDQWIYVEDLNNTQPIIPLYKTQLDLRLNSK